ncbi:hypothetical protein D1872_209690 [compost metagenome]
MNAPRAIVPGMRRFGISAALNSSAANGYTANATTNKETPPYVRMAPTSTIASIARLGPIILITALVIDFAKPDISITFPKMAPNKNTGK